MSRSLTQPFVTLPDKPLVTPRPTPAKADLKRQPMTTSLSDLVSDTLRRVFGKQELAAKSVEKDPGNFNRDLKRITQQLEALGPEYLAELGAQLTRAFGPCAASPSQRVRMLANQLREIEDELAQLADHIEEVA